jgi:hypothetical protein
MVVVPNFNGSHLADRFAWAEANLKPVQPQYCIVWERPFMSSDECCKITTPAPKWLAAMIHGGIFPDIEAYLRDKEITDAYEKQHGSQIGFDWREMGGAAHPYAKPRGAMTEEEAIEYLIQKDIPTEIWRPRHNRQIMKIVKRSSIPNDRTHRNSWRLNNLELEAA